MATADKLSYLKTTKEEIKTAIIDKGGTVSDNATFRSYAAAITAIKSGGVIESLDITSNGTYTAPEGVDGYNPITVNVPQEGGPPEEAFVITGNCSYHFKGCEWFLKEYGSQIHTVGITQATFMFKDCATVTEIPFDFNFVPEPSYPYHNELVDMFNGCSSLTSIGDIVGADIQSFSTMFYDCHSLKDIPNFINCDFSRMKAKSSISCTNPFDRCFSLRKYPDWVIDLWEELNANTSYHPFKVVHLHSLDEFIIPIFKNATITSNLNLGGVVYGSTNDNFSRIKNFIFRTNEDGTPKVASWKSQTINLAAIGYTALFDGSDYILNYNSGITADKEVTDDATYQALKDDPDWFTRNVAYSRYNHDSAVATINSLPDTSAYLATAGGTNTITFMGNEGSATDGGAINTLTEEEIAVATAKGWTITFK